MPNKEILANKAWWDAFISSLTEQERAELNVLEEPIEALDIYSYIEKNDKSKVDLALSRLKPKNRYDLDLAPRIYKFYSVAGFPEEAFEYVSSAISYFEEIKIPAPSSLIDLLSTAENSKLAAKIRNNLALLGSMQPKSIPHALPVGLNGSTDLQKFIFVELAQGLKILRIKIRAAESIIKEDRYTDVLLATLRLRFAIWNWEISEQDPKGVSPGGIDPGEVDLTIRVRGNDIALIEAMVLPKPDSRTYTEEHLLKGFNYDRNLKLFFSIVYFKGDRSKFNDMWFSYKDFVLATKYPTAYTLDTTQNFLEITNWLTDIKNIYFGVTYHGGDTHMYHIMIDLSEDPALLAIAKARRKSVLKKKTPAKKARTAPKKKIPGIKSNPNKTAPTKKPVKKAPKAKKKK